MCQRPFRGLAVTADRRVVCYRLFALAAGFIEDEEFIFTAHETSKVTSDRSGPFWSILGHVVPVRFTELEPLQLPVSVRAASRRT